MNVVDVLIVIVVTGGTDAQDAVRCRSLSAKEPLIIELFCRKRHIKIRHPMPLHHPVDEHCKVHLR